MQSNKYDDMYMDIARVAARESKCPRKQVGCCILLESGMIAIGFNGHASGGPNEWEFKEDGDPEVVHAELNALGKLLEQGVSAKNSSVYLTYSPCLECAKLLVRAKVSRVVYLEQYRKTEGLEYLKKYGVKVEKYSEAKKGAYSYLDLSVTVAGIPVTGYDEDICCMPGILQLIK